MVSTTCGIHIEIRSCKLKVVEKAYLNISEIVLTGVDITSYPYGFNSLIRRLVTEVEGLKRLRLGSLDPACVDDELMELLLSSPILMPHLHLSVQAGDNLVLKRMGRRHTAEQIIQFCTHLKKMCPDFVLGGDFITGFPTETEEQFLNTCQLVQEAQITQLHVFPYSVRLGTPAAKMPMVDMGIRKERATRLRQLGLTLEHQLLDKMIGTIRPVLIEREGHGYTDNYLKVQVSSGQIGSIIPVKITKRSKNELVGEA